MFAKPLGWIALTSWLSIAGIAQAESVACHVTYGGETRIVEARPSASPYAIVPVSFGSYFLFRIVFRQQPADLAGIKIYTYIDRDSGPVLIHQASYTYPPRQGANLRNPPPGSAQEAEGFTGRHWVYEAKRDSELQYWCELKGSEK